MSGFRLHSAILCTLLSATPTFAQNAPRFQGRVVNETTGKPVAGATISIPGDTGSAKTDSEGRFSWEPAPTPPFQLIIVLPGGQVARPVEIASYQDGVADIHVSPLANEAITVLGAAPSIETAPASGTTVLTATQIAQRIPENLIQALETVPGVTQVSEGHAAAPAVRGMARGRTLFLVDGGRVTSERRTGPSVSFLDPSVIEGIDVARGPGSVAYGSDAIGGVISVRTRRAEPGSPLRARVHTTIGAGIPEARGSFEVSKGLARGGILMQAHIRNAEDYDSPRGEVFNSGWEDQGFLVHFTHAIGKGFLSTAWQSDFAREVERPRNNSGTVRFFYPFEDSHRFTASYELTDIAGLKSIAFTGFFGLYEQRTDQDRFATPTAGRGIERADISANDFHVKGSAERLIGSKARLEFGVDLNGRFNLEALDVTQAYDLGGELTLDDTNVSVEDARRTNVGIYFQAETMVGSRTRVSGGVRGDRVRTRNTGGFFGDRSTANAAAAGFGAVTFGPFKGLSLSAQVARGFRDSTLSDRYFRGPSGRGFITGNPDLEPETTLQLDLATRYTVSPRAQVAVYFYQYRITNLIERFEAEQDFFFFRNRGRARLRGFEVEATADLGRGYSLEFAGQVARGEALDDGAHLDDVSPESIAITGRKQIGDRAYAMGRLAFHAEDERPGPSEVSAPGATLLEAGGGWRLTRNLELRGAARNLLNEEYYASPDPRFVLAPGRSVSLTAVVQF
jgi:outer membrane receptor protein involved in Fe transport